MTHMDDVVRRAEHLRSFHVPGDPLLLINVWDIASARVVASNPATQAIATASWSFAAAQGFGDGQQVPLDTVLDFSRKLVESVDLPVTVDFEKGYAHDLDTLGENIRRLCQTGVAGLNIEDSIGDDDGPCWALPEAAARIACVREAALAEGLPIVINARTDVLAGGESPAKAIERGNAYLAAGADCVFVLEALGPRLSEIVNGMAGPVSVLAGHGAPPLSDLARLGVARISVGPGSMGVAYAALQGLLTDVLGDGEWPPQMQFRPGPS